MCIVVGTEPEAGLARRQRLFRAQGLPASEQEPGLSSLCLSQGHQGRERGSYPWGIGDWVQRRLRGGVLRPGLRHSSSAC